MFQAPTVHAAVEEGMRLALVYLHRTLGKLVASDVPFMNRLRAVHEPPIEGFAVGRLPAHDDRAVPADERVHRQ